MTISTVPPPPKNVYTETQLLLLQKANRPRAFKETTVLKCSHLSGPQSNQTGYLTRSLTGCGGACLESQQL